MASILKLEGARRSVPGAGRRFRHVETPQDAEFRPILVENDVGNVLSMTIGDHRVYFTKEDIEGLKKAEKELNRG